MSDPIDVVKRKLQAITLSNLEDAPIATLCLEAFRAYHEAVTAKREPKPAGKIEAGATIFHLWRKDTGRVVFRHKDEAIVAFKDGLVPCFSSDLRLAVPAEPEPGDWVKIDGGPLASVSRQSQAFPGEWHLLLPDGDERSCARHRFTVLAKARDVEVQGNE